MVKNEITYMFGAGASCQSMPLVSNFPNRFSAFIHYLKQKGYKGTKIIQISQDFERQIKSHLSFDTFFKKLFHQNRTDDTLNFKCVLLIFLLFEHLVELKDYENICGEGKSHNIDPRYDALV